jgi:mgtE-like transporter
MSASKSVFAQQVAVFSACALLDLLAGSVLERMRFSLEALPGLIILIPPLIDMRGNIGIALGSRLGTALHLGTLEPKFAVTPELKVNILSAIVVSVIASLAIGLLSIGAGIATGNTPPEPHLFITIALLAGVLSGLVLIPITVLVAFIAYRRKWDPDNITSPVMTTLGDIITIICIFAAVVAVGWS